jgi:hypothetical protein
MELILTTKEGFRFKVVKEKDDPMTNRLSIGGSKEEGCYIVYRGETTDCLKILEQALEVMNKANGARNTQLNQP